MQFNGKQREKKSTQHLHFAIFFCSISDTQTLDRKSTFYVNIRIFFTMLLFGYMRYNPHFTPLNPSLICPCRIRLLTPSQRSSCFVPFFFTYFPFIFAMQCKIIPTQEFKDHGVLTPPLRSRKNNNFFFSLPIFFILA